MMGMGWWWIIVIVIIIAVVVFMMQSRGGSTPGGPAAPHRETPLQTLERRYAAGEISTEEYEERKTRLQG